MPRKLSPVINGSNGSLDFMDRTCSGFFDGECRGFCRPELSGGRFNQGTARGATNGPGSDFFVTVKNSGRGSINCLLPTAQVYDVLVLLEGRVVWRWSHEMRFAAVLTPFSLPPDGARTYRVDWQMSRGVLHDIAGAPLKPGSYQAVAAMKVRPEILSQRASLQFFLLTN